MRVAHLILVCRLNFAAAWSLPDAPASPPASRPEHGDFIFNSMTKRKCVALLPTVWKEPWCGWEQLGMENESYRWSIGRNFFPRCAPRHPPWPLNYRLTF